MFNVYNLDESEYSLADEDDDAPPPPPVPVKTDGARCSLPDDMDVDSYSIVDCKFYVATYTVVWMFLYV